MIKKLTGEFENVAMDGTFKIMHCAVGFHKTKENPPPEQETECITVKGATGLLLLAVPVPSESGPNLLSCLLRAIPPCSRPDVKTITVDAPLPLLGLGKEKLREHFVNIEGLLQDPLQGALRLERCSKVLWKYT